MTVIKRGSRVPWPTRGFAWPEDRIDHMIRDMFRDGIAGRVLADRFADGLANPLRVEEFIEDGNCVIRAELPGIDPDKDIEIRMQGGMLDVRARREERKEEERPAGYRSEFHYGSFKRVIRLPEDVREEDIKATYKDGVLEVRLPMTESRSEPTRVPVEHA